MIVYMLKNGGVILGLYSSEEKAKNAADKDIKEHFRGSIVDKEAKFKRAFRNLSSNEEITQLWVLSPSGVFYTISKINVQ